MPATSSSHSPVTWFQQLLPMDLPEPELVARRKDGAPIKTPENLPRQIGLGLLTEFCNPDLVDRILADCSRLEQRCRLLPARLVVYATLLMALHPNLAYSKLLHLLAESAPGPGSWQVPNKSSFARARARLGFEVMEKLYHAQARPLAEEHAAGCWWRGRRIMAIDGTTFDLAPTADLEKAFGGPTTKNRITRKKERTGLPQLRAAALIECGTRALANVVFGPYSAAEIKLAAELLPSVTPGMLILADRNFPGVKLWKRFTNAGADLLWRTKASTATRILEHLPDGSYLALFGSGKNTITVRVIEYTVEGSDQVYRLLTNMLDHRAAPAHELAALYTQRWEIETAIKEIKVTQAGSQNFRSLSVDGVQQEFWANCLLYQLSRQLVYQAAMTTKERDCDRISFSAAQDAIRRSIVRVAGLAARKVRAAVLHAITEVTARAALIDRRLRSAPRIVRHKSPKFPSRSRHSGPLSTRLTASPETFVLEAI